MAQVIVASVRDVVPEASNSPIRRLLASGRSNTGGDVHPDPHHSSNTSKAEGNISLWQLLMLQSSGERERREMIVSLSAAGDTAAAKAVSSSFVAGASSLANNLLVGRCLDMQQFLLSKNIRRAALDSKSASLSPVFVQKLKLCRRVASPYREKFVRWELIKAAMVHGMHQNGILADDQGSGSAVWLPLRMTREPIVDASLPVIQQEQRFEELLKARQERLFCADSRHVITSLYRDLEQRGGTITKPVYFALMQIFCRFTLLHLDDRDTHLLITLDFEVDCQEAARSLRRRKGVSLERKRAQSTSRGTPGSTPTNATSGGGEEGSSGGTLRKNSSSGSFRDPHEVEVLNQHSFQRFVASLAFIWMESNSSSFEFSHFVEALRSIWVPRTGFFDLDYVVKYTKADVVDAETSLVPVVEALRDPAINTDDVVLCLGTYEIIKSIFVRFRLFTAGKDKILEKAKLKWYTAAGIVSLPSAPQAKEPESTQRQQRRQSSLTSQGSLVFGGSKPGLKKKHSTSEMLLSKASSPSFFTAHSLRMRRRASLIPSDGFVFGLVAGKEDIPMHFSEEMQTDGGAGGRGEEELPDHDPDGNLSSHYYMMRSTTSFDRGGTRRPQEQRGSMVALGAGPLGGVPRSRSVVPMSSSPSSNSLGIPSRSMSHAPPGDGGVNEPNHQDSRTVAGDPLHPGSMSATDKVAALLPELVNRRLVTPSALPSGTMLGLDVMMAHRHPQEAPSVRQAQYLCFKPAHSTLTTSVKPPRPAATFAPLTDSSAPPPAVLEGNPSVLGSRLLSSRGTESRNTLGSVLRHRYHRARADDIRRGREQAAVQCDYEHWMAEAYRQESSAALGALGGKLAPIHRLPRLADASGASPTSIQQTYDLGMTELRAKINNVAAFRTSSWF